MSGATSAFLNGYLADVQTSQGRKRDLELSELLDLCAKPESQEERIATVQRLGAMYPELKYFLIVAYFCKNAFSELNSLGPIDYKPASVPKGGSVETLKSMWEQVTRLYDSFPSGPKIKRGIAYQLLSSLHEDEAELIQQIIQGKYYRKELNEIVVQRAFPKETPQDPKV